MELFFLRLLREDLSENEMDIEFFFKNFDVIRDYPFVYPILHVVARRPVGIRPIEDVVLVFFEPGHFIGPSVPGGDGAAAAVPATA